MAVVPVEDLNTLKSRLRELKEEWISNKPGRGKATVRYIDKDTVIQILEYATNEITEWHFSIDREWKEEIYAKNKQTNEWYFDGYVYHVKGTLTIAGLGSRTQYGKKVAEGGANNQDSAYQAAASTCLSKCASMFGVGEKLYTKNQIEFYETTMKEFDPKGYQEMISQPGYNQVGNNQGYDANAMNGGNQYQQQAFNQNQNWNQNNKQQQQEWNQNQQQNGYQNQQQNFVNQQPMNGGMNAVTNGTQNYQQQQQQENTSPWVNTDLGQAAHNVNWQQTTEQVDLATKDGSVTFPFEQAAEKNFEAQTQGQVQENGFQAQTMGAPVINDPVQQQSQQSSVAVLEKPKTEQQLPDGSDQQQLFMAQVVLYNEHRTRLGIQDDEGMKAYLRDYFQNENADTSFLNMETIKGFNEYMKTIQG